MPATVPADRRDKRHQTDPHPVFPNKEDNGFVVILPRTHTNHKNTPNNTNQHSTTETPNTLKTHALRATEQRKGAPRAPSTNSSRTNKLTQIPRLYHPHYRHARHAAIKPHRRFLSNAPHSRTSNLHVPLHNTSTGVRDHTNLKTLTQMNRTRTPQPNGPPAHSSIPTTTKSPIA